MERARAALVRIAGCEIHTAPANGVQAGDSGAMDWGRKENGRLPVG
jgi:hypothetical protein